MTGRSPLAGDAFHGGAAVVVLGPRPVVLFLQVPLIPAPRSIHHAVRHVRVSTRWAYQEYLVITASPACGMLPCRTEGFSPRHQGAYLTIGRGRSSRPRVGTDGPTTPRPRIREGVCPLRLRWT